ncbi:MAG: type II toxin-antitoxin system RelE/ParE family toxin [Candidatus Omnitrophota bacterium]
MKQSAEKELRKIQHPHLTRILSKIEALRNDPRPAGIKLLKGEDRYYRLRMGDYRIIYEVDDRGRNITLIKIGHRREVYGDA